MKKTITFTYEEEHAIVDALIYERIRLEKELAVLEELKSDCSVPEDRRICAANLGIGDRKSIDLLVSILARMSAIPYEVD